MQKRKLRSDDEVRSQRSHYTNVSKISSKHVELSLEVEMDDEVREIIKSPQKCTSALLDVTVIKPKGLDKYTTEKQILKTDQVKSMIAAMKLDNGYKKTLMEKLFGESGDGKHKKGIGEKKDRAARRSRERGNGKPCLSSKIKRNSQLPSKKLEQRDLSCVTEDANSAVYSMCKQPPCPKGSLKTQHQQIYTSPRTYENIRSMFECTKKEKQHIENDKMEQPCMCQNCAIVGILTDSQKKPFATEPMPDPRTVREPRYRRPVRRKSVTFKHLESLPSTSRPHEHDQCEAIFKLLSSRISELERRVAMQEEKAVPKDYFKKIITKLVTHLTKLTNYSNEERSMASSNRHKDPPQSFNKYRPNLDKHSRYYVNPVLLETTYKIPAEKEYDPKPCSSSEPPKTPSDGIWKWGEEFLTSGRDLKNKVVVLLEETLHNLKKGWEKPESQEERFGEDMQSMVQELTKNLAKTVRRSPEDRPPCSVQIGKRMVYQVAEAQTDKLSSNLDKKSTKPSLIPRFMRKKGPSVNVAYINPQLKGWPEESAVSFKIDSSDYEMQKEVMSEVKKKQYKKEFLKVLNNTKTADKFKLWQNIWNQALENRQTKKDIVSIQIPDPKDLVRQKMIHLEYTIEELEKLLTGVRQSEEKKK